MPDRIVIDPKVMLGRPVIRGTRITVEHILEQLAGGATVETLLQAHGRLTEADIRAALAFAADSVRTDIWSPTERRSA